MSAAAIISTSAIYDPNLTGGGGQLFKFLHVEVGATHNERHEPIRSSLQRAEPKCPPHECCAAFFFLCLHINCHRVRSQHGTEDN